MQSPSKHRSATSKILDYSQAAAVSTPAIASGTRIKKFFAIIIATLACIALVAGLIDHPYGSWLPGLAAILYMTIAYRVAGSWLFFIPALLPVIDQTPRTGRVFFTESDLLILCSLVVAYAPYFFHNRSLHKATGARLRMTRALLPAMLLLFFGYCIGTFKAWVPIDAESLANYQSAWNSLRIAKGFFWPLLFIPLLKDALQNDAATVCKKFAFGLCTGLALVAASAVAERLSFTGLADFSSDYRITASFWEMNVGGAALDGFLTLSMPFALWFLFTARKLRSAVPALLLLSAASYVVLVTFTRTTYAAVAVLVLIVMLGQWKNNHSASHAMRRRNLHVNLGYAVLACVLLYAMHRVFQSGGYRTLAALIAVIVSSCYVGEYVQCKGRRAYLQALLYALAMMALAVAAHRLMNKGSYLYFGTVAAIFFVLTMVRWQRSNALFVGLWAGLLVSAALIGLHWGGRPALNAYAPFAILIVLLVMMRWRFAKTQAQWNARTAAGLLMTLIFMGMSVAVLGNYQMSVRFGQSNQNLHERENHWAIGLGFLHDWQDWAWGLGLGSFPRTYARLAPENKLPGSIAFVNDEESRSAFVRMQSNHFAMGSGEMLRLMQRVPAAEITQPIVSFRARSGNDVKLVFEVCARHLLYPEACAGNVLRLPPDHQWHNYRIALSSGRFELGHWYAPHPAWFAFGTESGATRFDLTDLQLIGAHGTELLRNADFKAGSDFWFFTSDRHHLPWHIKNLFLNMLLDQGVLGLIGFVIFVGAALLRCLKHWRDWPEAPYFCAAIVGFLCEGVFDSLLDVPRLAVLFYFLCWMILLRPKQPFRASLRASN